MIITIIEIIPYNQQPEQKVDWWLRQQYYYHMLIINIFVIIVCNQQIDQKVNWLLTLFNTGGGADLPQPRTNAYTRKKSMGGNSANSCIFLN